MAKIKVLIYNKQKKISVTSELKKLIKEVCAAAVDEQGFDKKAHVSVSLVDNEQIRCMNSQFRDIDRATDVLSFPLGENGVYDTDFSTGECLLGDIVISLERASEQAQQYGHSYQREVGFLTAHSMLHLFGFDHVNSEEEAELMRKHERAVMQLIGLER